MDDAQLAEYSTLRDEQLRCVDAQRDLIKLNITGSGAVAALAIANASAPGLLVILSFLSPVLGLLWIDQDSKIHRVALYVRTRLFTREPNWENWLISVKEKDRPTRILAFTVPNVIVFLLPAIAGLIVSGHHWDDIGGEAVWWSAFVPIVAYVLVGAVYLRRRPRHGKGKGNPPASQVAVQPPQA